MPQFTAGDLIFQNPLAAEADVADWIREGEPILSFPAGKMRLENAVDPSAGQAANYLLWCHEPIPGDFQATWTFRPIREPGLAMFWFAANGHDGRDLFDPALAKREGIYRQYFDSDIDAYHLSYFRRKNPEDERTFHTCNMRKSAGFHLVTQGADPIPSVIDVVDAYRIEVTHCQQWIRFRINDLLIFEWYDDGSIGRPPMSGGYIGFRQMAPLIADYSDLQVRSVTLDESPAQARNP
jgi:hypothetical protein